MNDLNFFDRIRTELRLFLMGNRELIVLFGIVVLAASVIYSSRIITFPTRVPTRAITISPTPTPISTPTTTTITFPTPTPSTSGGFLELLQLSPTLVPSPTPTLVPITEPAPSGTIFLPPVQR